MHHGPARHDAGWRRDPGSRHDLGTRYGLRPRHGAGSPADRGTWPGPPGSRAAGWRADPGRGTAGLRRFRPAAMAPAAIAACTLGAVALAGLIVIAVSIAVAASAPGGLAASGSLSQALEACSGELALLALTVAVVLGVAATERHILPAATRVTAQLVHRAVALIAVGFLIVHILLETVSDQAGPLAAVLPFSDAGDRLYLGLGTIASDLVIAIIGTSLARMRYARSAHPQLWRMVHRSIYVAWPLAILHGILEGGGPVWAAWTYGICAALVAVAISARVRMQAPPPRAPGADLADLADLRPALPAGPGARRPQLAARSPFRPGSPFPAGPREPRALEPPAGDFFPGGDDPYTPRPKGGNDRPRGDDAYGLPSPAGGYRERGDHAYGLPSPAGGYRDRGDHPYARRPQAAGGPQVAPYQARRRAWRPVQPRRPGAVRPPEPPWEPARRPWDPN